MKISPDPSFAKRGILHIAKGGSLIFPSPHWGEGGVRGNRLKYQNCFCVCNSFECLAQ